MPLLLGTSGVEETRCGWARAVLEIGIKLREVAELEDRFAALEEQSSAGSPLSLRRRRGGFSDREFPYAIVQLDDI